MRKRRPQTNTCRPQGILKEVLCDKAFYGENYKISQELRSREPIKKLKRSEQEEKNQVPDIESDILEIVRDRDSYEMVEPKER